MLTLAIAASLPAQTSDDEKAKRKQQIEQLRQENQQLCQAVALSSEQQRPQRSNTPPSYFSWRKWHHYLQAEHPDFMKWLDAESYLID